MKIYVVCNKTGEYLSVYNAEKQARSAARKAEGYYEVYDTDDELADIIRKEREEKAGN